MGSSAYYQNDIEGALNSFGNTLDTEDDQLKSKSYYNLARILQDKNELEKSLALYKKSLELDPSDIDAKVNYELLKNQIFQNQKQKDEKNKDENDTQDEKNQQNKDGSTEKQLKLFFENPKLKEEPHIDLNLETDLRKKQDQQRKVLSKKIKKKTKDLSWLQEKLKNQAELQKSSALLQLTMESPWATRECFIACLHEN